ncbi:MAG: hypothetical protein MHMPM18_004384 [Marteilia pararefringens]
MRFNNLKETMSDLLDEFDDIKYGSKSSASYAEMIVDIGQLNYKIDSLKEDIRKMQELVRRVMGYQAMEYLEYLNKIEAMEDQEEADAQASSSHADLDQTDLDVQRAAQIAENVDDQTTEFIQDFCDMRMRDDLGPFLEEHLPIRTKVLLEHLIRLKEAPISTGGL